MQFNSVSAAAMEKAFNSLWQRQQLINDNIVNQDTPGYKAKHIDFESALRQELNGIKRSNAGRRDAVKRIENLNGKILAQDDTITKADGNNVNVDNEYIEMVRTQIQYNALQEKISGHYSMLKYAITGGR